MVDKESLVGAVRQWTLTPLVETIKAPCSPGGPMVGVEQRTGLARALGVEDLVTTPTDTAALAALFRAAVRPPAAARESMRRAHVEEDYVPKTQDGLAEVKRTRALSVSAVKFRGVSLITFAWVYVRPSVSVRVCYAGDRARLSSSFTTAAYPLT